MPNVNDSYLLNAIMRDKSDFSDRDALPPMAALASEGNLFSVMYSRSKGVSGSTKTCQINGTGKDA